MEAPPGQLEWCAQLLHWEKKISSDAYRTSELRNILVQKIHVPLSDVNKLIDMAEIRTYALNVLAGIKESDCSALAKSTNYASVSVAVAVVLFASYWILANKRLQKWVSQLSFISETSRMKFKILSRGLRRRKQYFAVFLAGFSIALELLTRYVQFSVAASFLMPSSWSVRRFLMLGPHLPVTTSMLKGVLGETASNSNYGINFGPMVVIFICNKLISFLDDRLATSMG